MKKEQKELSFVDNVLTVRSTFKISEKSDQAIKILKEAKSGIKIIGAFELGLKIIEAAGVPASIEMASDRKIRRTFVIPKNVFKRIETLAKEHKTTRDQVVSWIVSSFDSVLRSVKGAVAIEKLEEHVNQVDAQLSYVLIDIEEIFGKESEYYKTISDNLNQIVQTLEAATEQIKERKIRL